MHAPAVVASLANSWTTPRLIREKLVKSNDYIVHCTRAVRSSFCPSRYRSPDRQSAHRTYRTCQAVLWIRDDQITKNGGETGLFFFIAVAILAVNFKKLYIGMTALATRKDQRKKILLNTNRTFRHHGLPQQWGRKGSSDEHSPSLALVSLWTALN